MNEFIGVQALKKQQAEQLDLFNRWAREGHWELFHLNHYDWWTFPIMLPSSKGFAYSLNNEAISELSLDEGFIQTLRRCTELLLTAYGWDWEQNRINANPAEGQYWNNHPIRLAKCNDSLKIFGQSDLVLATRRYADWLKAHGEDFEYMRRDLYAEIQSDEHNR